MFSFGPQLHQLKAPFLLLHDRYRATCVHFFRKSLKRTTLTVANFTHVPLEKQMCNKNYESYPKYKNTDIKESKRVRFWGSSTLNASSTAWPSEKLVFKFSMSLIFFYTCISTNTKEADCVSSYDEMTQ